MKNVKSPLAARALREAHLAASGVWDPLVPLAALLVERISSAKRIDGISDPHRRQQVLLSVVHGEINVVKSTGVVRHDTHVTEVLVHHLSGCCVSKLHKQAARCAGRSTSDDAPSPARVPGKHTNEGVLHDEVGRGSEPLHVESDDPTTRRETVDGQSAWV